MRGERREAARGVELLLGATVLYRYCADADADAEAEAEADMDADADADADADGETDRGVSQAPSARSTNDKLKVEHSRILIPVLS